MSPSRLARAVLAQTATEIQLTLKRGESLLVTLIIPAMLLIFFASVPLLPRHDRSINVLLAATLSLAVISTGLVSLGIATAYERYYGVLKRLGITPMPRGGLVAAKMLSVLAFECLQALVLVAIAAVFFGWRPHGSIPAAILLLLAGSAAFGGLGMAMAGRLRAEATLAGANGLFLFFLLLGGLYVPASSLPHAVGALAGILPSAALATNVRDAMTGSSLSGSAVLILLLWAVGAPLVAARVFRWE